MTFCSFFGSAHMLALVQPLPGLPISRMPHRLQNGRKKVKPRSGPVLLTS